MGNRALAKIAAPSVVAPSKGAAEVLRSRVALTAISVVGFLVSLDTTIVGVVLPEMGRTLQLSFSGLQWVVNAYSLAFVALLMTGGALADRFGRRLILIIGTGLFAVASIGCGLAVDGMMLHAARATQGIGAALMMSGSVALLAQLFPDRAARAGAFGVWGTAVGLGVGLGPLIGGIVSQTAGWPWVFLLNLPIAGLVIGASLWATPESHDPHAARFDFGGVVVFAAALFFLVFALVSGNEAHWGIPIIGMAALSLALLAGFAALELRQDRPMLDVGLFRRPEFVGVCLAPVATSISFWSLFIFLPLYLRGAYGLSPFTSGVALAPLALPMLAVPALAQHWLEPRLSTRAFLGGGLAAIGIGAVTAAVGVHFGNLVLGGAGLLLTGLGAAAINAESANAVVSRVPIERSGMASGIAGTMRQLGFGLGIAALGAVLNGRVHDLLQAGAQAAPWRDQVDTLARKVAVGDLASATSALPLGERGAFAAAAHGSLDGAFGALLLVAGGVALASAALIVALVPAGRAPATRRDATTSTLVAGKGGAS